MRPLLLAPALVAALFLPSISAHADEMRTFAFSGTYGSFGDYAGGTVTGTLAVDVNTGFVMAYDFSVPIVQPGNTWLEKDQLYSTQTASLWPASPTLSEAWRDPSNLMGKYEFLSLNLAPTNDGLVNYSGGPICSATFLCVVGPNQQIESSGVGDTTGAYTQLQSGTFTQTGDVTGIAPTPEPSSLALLGTGVLGMFGVIRRKLA